MDSQNSVLWNVFVGENGDYLKIFNEQFGPYPPEKGLKGLIAIGWPAVGDMRIYKNKYSDYAENFETVYPSNRRIANMLWNFAYVMQKGDWVISHSSYSGYVLLGEIIGDYKSDFHDETGLYGKRREDYIHFRKIRWEGYIKTDSKSYQKLPKPGQLTVSKSTASIDELKSIFFENSDQE